MTSFSPTDAALEGFRIARENPRAVAAWWAVSFAGGVAMTAIMGGNGAGAAMNALAAANPSDPAAALGLMQDAAVKLLTAMAPLIVVQIFIQAGVLRLILKPQGRAAPLALGGDELRVLLAMLITMVAAFGVVFIGTVIIGVLAAIGGAALVPLLSFLLTIGAVLLVSVRLCLLAPFAIAEKRVNVLAAWRATRGHFMPILGALAIATILSLVISILGGGIIGAISTLLGLDPAPASVAAALSPGMIAVQVVQSLLQALSVVVMLAPPAIIWRGLAPSRPAEVF